MNKVKKDKTVREEYERVRSSMLNDGYVEKIHTISKLKAQIIGALIPIVLTIIVRIVYLALSGDTLEFELNYVWFFVLIIISIITHELLHGLAWSFSCKQGFKSIVFSLNGFMPMCHCREVLSWGNYLIGALMPFLVLGIGFTVAAFILTDGLLLLVANANYFFAGADLLIAITLLKARKAKIFDHPTEPGFIAFTTTD